MIESMKDDLRELEIKQVVLLNSRIEQLEGIISIQEEIHTVKSEVMLVKDREIKHLQNLILLTTLLPKKAIE